MENSKLECGEPWETPLNQMIKVNIGSAKSC